MEPERRGHNEQSSMGLMGPGHGHWDHGDHPPGRGLIMTTQRLTIAQPGRRLNSQRHRAITRASEQWAGGRYHKAIELLDEAGMTRAEIDEFIRAAHRVARRRTQRALTRR